MKDDWRHERCHGQSSHQANRNYETLQSLAISASLTLKGDILGRVWGVGGVGSGEGRANGATPPDYLIQGPRAPGHRTLALCLIRDGRVTAFIHKSCKTTSS